MNNFHGMESDLDLRLLRAFATLASVGSFTRTAKLMNVTQSAISHGMKRLESQAGCALLSKSGKSMQLTPEGRIFLSQVVRVLDALDRATASVSGRFSESRGTLSVAFPTSVAQIILAPVLREFRESYPRISVVVRLEDTPQAIQAVMEGRCDLAIAIQDGPQKSLRAHPLFQDRLLFVFSPLHPWARSQRITSQDMSREHFLLYQRQSVTFRHAEDFFLKAGVQLSSYVEIPSFEIMKQLARLGLGVALMASWVAAKEIENGTLLAKAPPKSPIRRQWALLHQGARDLRQPETTFIGLCKMACRKIRGNV